MKKPQVSLVAVLWALSVLWACSDLKTADPPPDAGTTVDSPDADPSVPEDARVPNVQNVPGGDGGTDAGRPPCPGTCMPEQLLPRANLGALAIDEANVYFSSPTSGAIARCPKDGCLGNPARIADVVTHRLALAGGKVWWGNAEKKQLESCPVDGCNQIPEVVLVNQNDIDDVVTDGDRIAWNATDGASDVVRTCSVGNCAAHVQLVATVSNIGAGMSAAPATVYFVESVTHTVRYCPLASTCADPPQLGIGQFDVVAQGGDVFWIADTKIVTCKATGCNKLPSTVASSTTPAHLAVDERDIYWRDGDKKAILRCPRTGCTEPETIATGISGTIYMTIALNGDYVYWTEERGLFRRHK